MYFFLLVPRPPPSTLFPYTTLFRSSFASSIPTPSFTVTGSFVISSPTCSVSRFSNRTSRLVRMPTGRSEEHTSELQSHSDIVCRLLLEKKKSPLRSQHWAAPRDDGH